MSEQKARKIGEVICEQLIEAGKKDPEITVLTSDSRGSGSLNPYVEALPKQEVEVGIAEQDLVTISAGLAHSGKRPFAVSPAAFLTMRSIEQVKVDVSYSNTNVKLIGISGGNSYSVLGATHHSLQDMAVTRSIPNLEIYMPCDQYQTIGLFKYLVKSNKPAYIRIGKKALPDIYSNAEAAFVKPGKANIIKKGKDVAIISMGETVIEAVKAAEILDKKGISATVVDLVSLKPLDTDLIKQLSQKYSDVYTVEESSIYGGIGGAVAEVIASQGNSRLHILGFPDEPAIAGTQDEVFGYYGLNGEGIAKNILSSLKNTD